MVEVEGQGQRAHAIACGPNRTWALRSRKSDVFMYTRRPLPPLGLPQFRSRTSGLLRNTRPCRRLQGSPLSHARTPAAGCQDNSHVPFQIDGADPRTYDVTGAAETSSMFRSNSWEPAIGLDRGAPVPQWLSTQYYKSGSSLPRFILLGTQSHATHGDLHIRRAQKVVVEHVMDTGEAQSGPCCSNVYI